MRAEKERRFHLRAIDRLAEFVRQAWPIVEPGTPLLWDGERNSGWHLDIICDALERQTRGEAEYRKLLICVPPGSMKSLLVSVFHPAWEWLHYPERRKLYLANDDRLTTRDSRRTREVVTSDWYQALVAIAEKRKGREPWTLARDQNEKVNFENTRRGFRQCLSIGASITGKRGDGIVIDDPLDAKEVVNGSIEQVAARLADVANVVDKVLPSRVNNLAQATWTVIMQRLAEEDTAGRAMREGGWKAINIQMEFEPGNPLNHPDDPRTAPGELMFPELFPAVELTKLRVKLGNDYSAQYQQNPLPRGGGPLKRWYWCFWYPRDVRVVPAPVMVRLPDGTMRECQQAPLPETLHQHTQSWDCAFKDLKTSSFVVGQLWAERGADSYLLDQLRDRMDIVKTIEAVRLLTKRWPQALRKLVEDKANGPAVVQTLKREIPGLLEIPPKGGKEARANAAAPAIQSGNVWIPHPALFDWVAGYLNETEAFPSEPNDQVDSTTQYLNHRYAEGVGTTQQLASW